MTLRLTHDDGVQHRELACEVRLPGVPRSGDRTRAGRAGNYFTVESVLWDDVFAPILQLVDATEKDASYDDLARSGWRVVYETRTKRDLSH